MSEKEEKKVDYLKAAKQYHQGDIASFAQSCALIAIAEQLTRIADAMEREIVEAIAMDFEPIRQSLIQDLENLTKLPGETK